MIEGASDSVVCEKCLASAASNWMWLNMCSGVETVVGVVESGAVAV